MLSIQIFTRVTLFAWLVIGSAGAIINHGKPIRGKADCKPVIFAAVIEAVLIYLAIWG